MFQTHHQGDMKQGSVVLPVIGYRSRQETEALMNEYAERGP
jgi:hypothetical protein